MRIDIFRSALEPKNTNVLWLKSVNNKWTLKGYGPSGWEEVAGAEDCVSKSYLETVLQGYVQVEDGKGLSTNDFTNDDKQKLDSLSPSTIDSIKYNEMIVPIRNKVAEIVAPQITGLKLTTDASGAVTGGQINLADGSTLPVTIEQTA